jgi:ribonuclease HI
MIGVPSMDKYTIIFDGGSIGNPGKAYGSFQIRAPGMKSGETVRKEFGHGTNNEAEYKTIIAALDALLERLAGMQVDPGQVELEIKGDSRLVIQQLNGGWKAKNPRMRELRDHAHRRLARFGSVRLVHQSRNHSVRVLGH